MLFIPDGKVIVGIVLWDNTDASADMAAACSDNVEDAIGISSEGEYRRLVCELVERLVCCVNCVE
jgi:hypothetical protein